MTWRKRSPPPTSRADAGEGQRAGRGRPDASEHLEAFARGLHPILLRADALAFRRYLAQWEDVIGDTTELGATPPDQLRRTMAALLRRPQQFGLPAWPAAPPEDAEAGPSLPLPEPLRAPPPPPAPPAPVAHAGPAPGGEPGEPAEPGDEDGGRGVYQLDMLTGELVPVPQDGVAEPEPAPYTAESEAVPAPRRRRRRGPPPGLKQLTLWPT